MRGFIITIVSISLIAILVVFSTVLHNSYLSMERVLLLPQPLTYTAFLFANVADNVHDIAGPELVQTPSNTSLRIWISDTLPNGNFSSDLSDYESFLEGELANSTNSVISANFSRLRPENMTFTINELYTYTIEAGDMIFTAPGGTQATEYDIVVTTDGVRDIITWFTFNSSGDMNVTITYTDLNGTEIASGTVYSNIVNRLLVTYEGGHKIEVTVGSVKGESGSLWIEPDGVNSTYRFYVDLPPINESEKKGYSYDADLDYNQGKIGKSTKIGK
jgi:hypothetical protein